MGDSAAKLNRQFGNKPGYTEVIPSSFPEDVNAYSAYIPDFLTINTPYQFPSRYKESLSGYAGVSGVDPVEQITDIFIHPEKYGIWQAPQVIEHKGQKSPLPIGRLFNKMYSKSS